MSKPLSPNRRSHALHAPRAPALAAAAVLGLCGSLAQAQSLQELYEAAHGYDAPYLAARANVDAATFRYDQSRASRLPTVSLDLSASRSLSSTPSALTESTNTTNRSATLKGAQQLYNRSNEVAITQAQKQIDAFKSDLDAAEQDLILRVSQAYFDVLAAQDNLATARASLAAISEQVASAKRNFEVGTSTITDTREAQARFDLARFTQIQAENDLLTKRILLDQTVGRANLAPRALAIPVRLPALDPSNVDDWVTRADAEHPAIRKARLALELAKLDTDKAKAGHLPTVAVSGNYSRGHADISGAAQPGGAYSYNTPNNGSAIELTVNVPIFSGFLVQNQIKERLVLEDKTLDDLETARRGVAQATRTQFYNVGSGVAQVGALEAAESSSKLALEATQLGFKVGVRVNIDVLNAQAQLYTTQAQLAKARYDLIMSGLRLRQASGHLASADVAAVNALLVR